MRGGPPRLISLAEVPVEMIRKKENVHGVPAFLWTADTV